MKKDKIHVFIESQTLQKFSIKNKENIERLLQYNNQKEFEFTRSPLHNEPDNLRGVDQFRLVFEGDRLVGIEFGDKEVKSVPSEYQYISANYQIEDIKLFVKNMHGKGPTNSNEFNSVLVIFIYLTFIRYPSYSKNSVFVTQNKFLLRHREWMEERLGKLQIMNL